MSVRLMAMSNLAEKIETIKSSADLDRAVDHFLNLLKIDDCEFIVDQLYDYVLENFYQRNNPTFIEHCLMALFALYASEIWKYEFKKGEIQ